MTSQSVEQGIADVIAEHQRAWNAHDADALMAMFEEPLDFVNVLGMHQQSAAALRQEFQSIHATFMKNTQIRMHANDARLVAPHVAVAHAHWEMTGMAKVTGWNAPDVRRGVMTYVMVRRAEKWKITAAHNTDVVEVPMPK